MNARYLSCQFVSWCSVSVCATISEKLWIAKSLKIWTFTALIFNLGSFCGSQFENVSKESHFHYLGHVLNASRKCLFVFFRVVCVSHIHTNAQQTIMWDRLTYTCILRFQTSTKFSLEATISLQTLFLLLLVWKVFHLFDTSFEVFRGGFVGGCSRMEKVCLWRSRAGGNTFTVISCHYTSTWGGNPSTPKSCTLWLDLFHISLSYSNLTTDITFAKNSFSDLLGWTFEFVKHILPSDVSDLVYFKFYQYYWCCWTIGSFWEEDIILVYLMLACG